MFNVTAIEDVTLDLRSERNLMHVDDDLVKVVRRAIKISSVAFVVVEGIRTEVRQNYLYEKGRTRPGPIVTWTRQSPHLEGRAVDFAALVNGQIRWHPVHLYDAVAKAFKQAAKELGVEIQWGGDWVVRDYMHVELRSFHR